MMRAAEVRQEHDLALGVYAKSLDDPARRRRPALRRAGDGRDDEDDGGLGQRHGGAGRAPAALGSENIANVDTPGYRRKTVSFEEAFERGERHARGATGPVRLDQAELARIHDPTNPLAGAGRLLRGSNVNLIVEIADAREANRSYEANLRMFDQARQMAGSLLDLLRR